MIRTCSLDDVCLQLFADYPPAAWTADETGTRRSMVLLLEEQSDSRFVVLTQDRSAGEPLHSVRPWPAGEAAVIGTGDAGDASGAQVKTLTRGIPIPIPRHGSLFGWASDGCISALVPVYAAHTLASPTPSWAVMPLAGLPEARWPPITRERFFGSWFWRYYRAGNLISLADLIAESPDTIFWAETKAILSSDSCAVTRDIRSPEGHLLRHGRYVYQHALRSGLPVPSLETLLAGTGTTDLSPRFRWFTAASGDG